MKLLTTSNYKIRKSRARQWMTFGLHLSPHTISGVNFCSSASPGCIESCLNTAGHGTYRATQDARYRRSRKFIDNPKTFLATLMQDVASGIAKATKAGYGCAFRLNLTSDIPWERLPIPGYDMPIMSLFPAAQFYDYTKSVARMRRYLEGKMPTNYHLTFSRSEINQKECEEVLDIGGSVAVVFAKRLPDLWHKRPVIDGDFDDLRFFDPHNSVVGLVAKGKGRYDTSGFVITNHL